ncbi:MAG TPA: spermidine/putrescine ABC transporter substrate-binding protein, partial [Opitutaceae bacterium]
MKQLLYSIVLAVCAATAASAAEKELNLFAWSEYVPQAVIEGFEKETGVKVNYETFASGEEMLAKLLAGGASYDLVQPPDYIAEALILNQLLIPLDYEKLPNFKNILSDYAGLPHDPEQRFTVPYMAGTVGIVVNTEKVKTPVTGYADLFAPEHKGRVVVVDDGRELLTGALYTLGYKLNDITPENIAKAKPVLTKWFEVIKVFDSDSPKTALLNGDADLGLVWGGEGAILWNEDRKFQYLLPSEGAHMFVDVLAIPSGAKHVGAAHQFINYILRPEVSKLIS